MDKVKIYLAVLKKYHFWVLCGVIFLTVTLVWSLASGSIQEQIDQHTQQIKSALDAAKAVQQVNQHPNEPITEEYKKQTEILKRQVFSVWNDLYKKQLETVLKWPAALGEGFIAHVASTPFNGKIPVDYRDIYHNYVKTRWAELPKIIKAKPVESDKNADGRPIAVTTRKAVPDYIVIWKDQEDIRRQLFSQTKPTNEWVWVTQEDLWIYETLLEIIRKTNAASIGPHNAVVSTIVDFSIGKQAASEAGGTGRRITSSASAGDGGGGEEGDNGAGSGGGEAPGMLSGRYVDAAGLPLSSGAEAASGEYKRIPVRMVLRMDSREIPELLLNCANAILPVEVHQVRINVHTGSGSSSKASESPDLSNEDLAAGRKVAHVEVSMQGIIYIFNPPSVDKLKLPKNYPDEGVPATTTAGEVFGAEDEGGTAPASVEPAAPGSADSTKGSTPAASVTPETAEESPAKEAAPPEAATAPKNELPSEAPVTEATPGDAETEEPPAAAPAPKKAKLEDLFE